MLNVEAMDIHMDIIIGVRAFFAKGGGEPLTHKILKSCPNFHKAVKRAARINYVTS